LCRNFHRIRTTDVPKWNCIDRHDSHALLPVTPVDFAGFSLPPAVLLAAQIDTAGESSGERLKPATGARAAWLFTFREVRERTMAGAK